MKVNMKRPLGISPVSAMANASEKRWCFIKVWASFSGEGRVRGIYLSPTMGCHCFSQKSYKECSITPLWRWVRRCFCPCKLCDLKQMSHPWGPRLYICLSPSYWCMMWSVSPPGVLSVGQWASVAEVSHWICSLQSLTSASYHLMSDSKKNSSVKWETKPERAKSWALQKSSGESGNLLRRGNCVAPGWGWGMEKWVPCVGFMEAPPGIPQGFSRRSGK